VTIDRHTPIDQLPELLRVDEAAQWLDCSRGTIYELARQHEDAAARVGRLLRIRRDWLASLAGRNGNSHAE